MTEMTELKTTVSNLKNRHLSCCKNYKEKKVVYEQILLQVENHESFEVLKRNSIDLHQTMEEQLEISQDTMLFAEAAVVRLDKMELDLKETKDKLDRTEIYLINTATILEETKEKGAKTQNELRETRIELKKFQTELKDTKAKTNLLSTYRDWVGMFNSKLITKLGTNQFDKIEAAFVDNDLYSVDISQYSCIKELEDKLKVAKMSYKEFKILFDMKRTSNKEFHRNPKQTIWEAKEQLREDLFPDNQKNLIVLLRKLFVTLEAWRPSNPNTQQSTSS